MSFFDPIKYGWHLVYAVEIEGIPILWSETATGHAAVGYTEALDRDGKGTLVMDGCGEIGQVIDRASGIGAGQSLTFKLRHCDAIETYLRRPTLTANLTVDLTATGATATVDSTAGWGATGTFWIDRECITYTGVAAGPPRFTGLTRGVYGSLPTAHVYYNSGRTISNLPRWWRGRQVRLWGYLVTPTGYVLPDRREIWRGHLNTGPDRDGRSWTFEALSLDRRLADDVLLPINGTVEDTAIRHPVYKADSVVIQGYDDQGNFDFLMSFNPFDSQSDGTLLTVQQQAELIMSAFSTARASAMNQASAAADLNSWLDSLTFGYFTKWGTLAHLTFLDGGIGANYNAAINVLLNGKQQPPESFGYIHWFNGGNSSKGAIWRSDGQLVADGNQPLFGPLSTVSQLTLNLGANADADISPSGWIRDGDTASIWYQARTVSGGICTFSDLRTAPDGAPAKVPADWTPGKELTISVAPTKETFAKFALTLLESSGTTGQRGTYDTDPANAGYALDDSSTATSAINASTFDDFPGPGNAMTCSAPAEDRASFASILGGLLAIQQFAVVSRADYDATAGWRVRLNLVDVSTVGSGGTVEVNDDELLTTGSEPVTTTRRRQVPNTLTVRATASADAPPVTVIDAPLARQQGTVEQSYDLPVAKIDTNAVVAWSKSILLSDQRTQAVQVRVGPWVDVDVGDQVWLATTHHGVWSWASGAEGYTGPARVIGAPMHPISLVKTLTLLIDAAPSSSLCPAAVVRSFVGGAMAPSSIDVDLRFLDHFSATMDASAGSFDLIHYIPGGGNENGGGTVTVSNVATAGGFCRLTISADTLAYNLVNDSSVLTLPTTANSTTYQRRFAHDGDGTQWL